MIPFPEPWLAGHVNRWHSGPSAPWLAHTNDRTAGHSGRMGIMALHIWPDCTRELLAACLCHDLGEYGACDAPYGAKADATLRGALDRLEDATLHSMGMSYSVSADDATRLKFLDRLDAYIWAQLHAPQVLDWPEWQAARRALYAMAEDMNVTHILDRPRDKHTATG